MELLTFGGALVAMKTVGGMVSGGGTVSDDSTGDDARYRKRTAAVPETGKPTTRRQSPPKASPPIGFQLKIPPDAAASESPAETAGDETDTESEPEPAEGRYRLRFRRWPDEYVDDPDDDDDDGDGGDDDDGYEEDDSMFADLF